MQSFVFPIITTQRLCLRKFSESDTEAVYNAFKNGDFTAKMLTEKQTDRIFAETYIEEMKSEYEKGDCYTWAVALKDCDSCVGAISLNMVNFTNESAELGYWISPEFMGCGYATESVSAIVRYAFEYMKLHRLSAMCRLDNIASMNVLKKNGFTIEGIAKESAKFQNRYVDIASFAIINK
ncbi:MAG: GNAT family N-acetyltransferase [Clostridia bacterium]|nr:GNAT family N-acetyltransferase [Clostridia bacterium]